MKLRNPAVLLAPAIAGLSVFRFFVDVFSLGLSEPMRIVLEQYEQLMQSALYPLSWLLNHIVEALNFSFSLNLDLQPHWVHIFVPVTLFVSSDVIADLGRRDQNGFKTSAISAAIYGYIIALIGAVLVGLAPLEQQTLLFAWGAMMTFVIYQVIRGLFSGMLLNKVGQSRADAIKDYLWRFAFYDFLMAVVAFLIYFAISFIGFSVPPLSLVLAFMFLMCLPRFWLPYQYWRSNSQLKEKGFPAYWNLGTVIVGRRILVTLIWFLLFILSNYVSG